MFFDKKKKFKVLTETSLDDLKKFTGEKIVEGIQKVRAGDIVIEPGYDGVFGTVKIWKEDDEEPPLDITTNQNTLF